MSETLTVVTAGYMPLDIIDDGAAIRRRAGGTAGNVAAILAALGWQSFLAGRIGDDAAGDVLREDLDRAGVGSRVLLVDHGARTNRLIHRVRPTGHSYAYSCPHCGQALPRSRPLRLDQVDTILALVPSPDVFFFDRANAATVLLAERYSENGALVMFEPSTPGNAALIQRAMRAATIVKGSQEHDVALVDSSFVGRADQLRIVTDGDRGARFRIGGGPWQRVGVFATDVVDAAGAGDWTSGGLLEHLVGGAGVDDQTVHEAISFGHALASLNCLIPGARGLSEGRTRTEIEELIARLRGGLTPELSNRSRAEALPGREVCSWCLLSLQREAEATAV